MKRYRWATSGDVNAFFGLSLDNIADLVLAVGLLSAAFGFPADFALRYMVPGTALGVLFGDLVYTFLAFRLARRTGRDDVTAMPLGLDTPSTFGMVLFVVGPAFLDAGGRGLVTEEAARHAWHVGICALLASGVFKLACALFCGWVRSALPRAGLLGSLAAIALVLISFLPLLDILASPIVGLSSLAIILTTLVARVSLPLRIPGALGALLVGTAMHYLIQATGWGAHSPGPTLEPVWLPTEWLSAWQFGWVAAIDDSLRYLPVVIPFALATVIGGIDCAESAAAAGDEYDTRQIIAVEGLATLLAALCGGVIQTVPYIGHPAYKAMGGRAAYTLATALFIGTAGAIGYFGLIYVYVPKPAVLPILIFVGLEITSQSFHATPQRHFAAVVLACVPAMAYLVMVFVDQFAGAAKIGGFDAGETFENLAPALAEPLLVLRLLSGGFIVTSLLWASMLAAIIDRRLLRAAAMCLIAATCTLFGVMHSPIASSPFVLPWELSGLVTAHAAQAALLLGAGYVAMAVLLACWALVVPADRQPESSI